MEYAGTARLATEHRDRLLDAARKSLEFGSRYGRAPPLRSLSDVPAPLRAMRASFVTLRIDGRLRGCIGTACARRPLLHDVVGNAYRAGFEDGRFRPVSEEEVARIEIETSVLSTPRPIRHRGEDDLARQLNPDIDGLVLRSGEHQGVFLPGVWERVPNADRFLQFLKNKAGLDADSWPDDARAFRFSVEHFGER